MIVYLFKNGIKRTALVFVLVLSLLPLGACTVLFPSPTAIERMEFCQALSVDKNADGFRLGVMLKKVKPSSQGTGDQGGGDDGEEIFGQDGKAFSTIVRDLQASRPKTIFFGDIEVILVSKSVLQNDFENFMDFFVRSRSFSEYSNVYAVDNNAYQMLGDMQKHSQDPVDIATKSKSPQAQMWTRPTNLLQSISLLQKHTSGTLPKMIKLQQEGKTEFELSGFVVIRDGKYVTELDKQAAFGLNILHNKLKFGIQSLVIDDGIVVGVDSINATTKIRPIKTAHDIAFDISIKVNAAITEISDKGKISGQELLDKSQEKLSSTIKANVDSCITIAKNVKADFIGFWQTFRFWHKQDAQELQAQWNDIIKNANINVSVKSQIKRTHLVEITK